MFYLVRSRKATLPVTSSAQPVRPAPSALSKALACVVPVRGTLQWPVVVRSPLDKGRNKQQRRHQVAAGAWQCPICAPASKHIFTSTAQCVALPARPCPPPPCPPRLGLPQLKYSRVSSISLVMYIHD